MIKYVNGREISRSSSVKVRNHLGATTEDVIDYVRPTARKKPKMMVIHSGTNDLTYKVNTSQKIRKVINVIKEDDVNNEIDSQKLENLCKGKGMRFIDNSNIKSSSLNRSKLHLNKSGTALLTKNFAKIVNSD